MKTPRPVDDPNAFLPVGLFDDTTNENDLAVLPGWMTRDLPRQPPLNARPFVALDVPGLDDAVNPYLDSTLHMSRETLPIILDPDMTMASGRDGYIHFSIVTTVGEEAAWKALNEEHAVPASVNVQLLRPANVKNGPIVGSGICLRRGKQILVSQGTVFQGEKMLAIITVTFTLFRKQE